MEWVIIEVSGPLFHIMNMCANTWASYITSSSQNVACNMKCGQIISFAVAQETWQSLKKNL